MSYENDNGIDSPFQILHRVLDQFDQKGTPGAPSDRALAIASVARRWPSAMRRSFCYIAIMLVGIVFGGLFMGLYDRYRSKRAPEYFLFEYFTLRIIEDVNALTELRRGETNDVIDNMERDLSGQIREFIEVFPKESLSRKDSIRILQRAARYRSEHPFKSGDADKDKAVEGSLARARAKE